MKSIPKRAGTPAVACSALLDINRFPRVTRLNNMMPFYWKQYRRGLLTLGEVYERILYRIETMIRLGDLVPYRRRSSSELRESRLTRPRRCQRVQPRH